jgi:arylsulfatase A-like enzyme
MMELDAQIGRIMDRVDQLGIRDNTIIAFTSDNGAMAAWWPDGGTTPFGSEKATTWEGGVRVPMLIRWPARIRAGSVSSGNQSHMDLFTTFAAAAGVTDVAVRLQASHNVHIDGVNNLAHWTQGAESALMFNLRMDPCEQRNGYRSNLLAMRKAYLGGRIIDILAEHQESLRAFPPRPAGGSLRPR